MFKYRIYGLNILSDIELRCYSAEFDKEDVLIKVTSEEATAQSWSLAACEPDLLSVMEFPDNYGKLYICGIACLIICYNSQQGFEFISSELLELPLSIILMNREIFTLHGNTIIYKDTGLVIMGDSGAGKSSLSAGFVKNNGHIIADDITRIHLAKDQVIAFPGCSSFKLWKNTAELFDIDLSNCEEVPYNKNKYIIRSSEFLLNIEAVVTAIICILPTDFGNVCLEQVSSKIALQTLLNNTYNVDWIVGSVYRFKYYQYLVDLCARVPVYLLYRPRSGFTVKEQINLLREEIINKGTHHDEFIVIADKV